MSNVYMNEYRLGTSAVKRGRSTKYKLSFLKRKYFVVKLFYSFFCFVFVFVFVFLVHIMFKRYEKHNLISFYPFLPPENILMLRQQENRQLSEHELRVQRSLSNLNIPDWYKKYGTGAGTENEINYSSTTLKQKNFGSCTGLAGGWSGLSFSKTSSLTSLQSAGRYSGRASSLSSSSRVRYTASTGGYTSRESLMSPKSTTASPSPTPYYERNSFTYERPYGPTRFTTGRMSYGGTSHASLSLSPSPSSVDSVGSSSTSTSTTSGPNNTKSGIYGGGSFTKQPYLGWRSQEHLNSNTLYRSPSERLAADLLGRKNKMLISGIHSDKSTPVILPKKETFSDVNLNNSEESNSQELNKIRSSIKEVSNAIVDYVNESKPIDDGTNDKVLPRHELVWLESSFIGTKPMDSSKNSNTPSVVMPPSGSHPIEGPIKKTTTPTVFRYDDQSDTTTTTSNNKMKIIPNQKENYNDRNGKSKQQPQNDLTSSSNSNYSTPYLSRNGEFLMR